MLKFVKKLLRGIKDLYIWLKQLYMYSIVAFLEARIDALNNNKSQLEKRIAKLETYIFELCEKECTEEYKTLVKDDVFHNDGNL